MKIKETDGRIAPHPSGGGGIFFRRFERVVEVSDGTMPPGALEVPSDTPLSDWTPVESTEEAAQ